jgi:exosome complex RNA-binding protein Rrp4
MIKSRKLIRSKPCYGTLISIRMALTNKKSLLIRPSRILVKPYQCCPINKSEQDMTKVLISKKSSRVAVSVVGIIWILMISSKCSSQEAWEEAVASVVSLEDLSVQEVVATVMDMEVATTHIPLDDDP